MTVSHPPLLDEGPEPAEDRRHMIRRRWLTAITILLLIGIPAGYLVISAEQSRESGRDKAAKYSATGLTEGWPSKLQRRIYEVPIPGKSQRVAYYETNNWRASRLYVQFLTSNEGLDTFLERLGADPADLKDRDITIGERDQDVVSWDFSGPGPWSGLVHEQQRPLPTRSVTVDRSDPDHPMVYVVSKTTP
ncbi:sugar kinase [Streptomyces apocyni]|uniref:sugar kinase n=1 Tax=Streptomyces apocyni TaxID=2654677 RepID=UPI0012EAF900|nr:sugar kinase [Streptomyces apocyni]